MPNLLFHPKLFSGRSLLKFLLLGLLIASFGLGYWLIDYFSIQKVQHPSSVSLSLIKPLYGQNIMVFDISELQNRIKAQNPLIREVSVTKLYPQTLVISTQPEKAIAQIPNQDLFLLVNERGKVIKTQPKAKQTLPLISFYQTLRTHETRPNYVLKSQDLQYALKLVSKKQQMPFELKQITIAKPGQIQIIPEADLPVVVITQKKNIAKNLYILQNIIKSLSKQGSRPKKIDLQFEKPVVTL